MISIPLSTAKTRLNFEQFSNPFDQINSVYSYIKIETIYCGVLNRKDDSLADTSQPFLVVREIGIPGGTPTYLKSLLKEEVFDYLATTLKQYLQGDDDYETISNCLTRSIDLCKKAVEENDRQNRYTFSEGIKFLIGTGDDWHPVLFSHLKLATDAAIDWEEHFDIRKGFYEKMKEEFSSALDWHLKKADPSAKPYAWDSKNPDLEISELIYLLYYHAHRIKINSDAGGSFAKFKRDFFGLFGRTDENYNLKVIQITKRKKDAHFVDELATLMPNTNRGRRRAK